MRLTVCFLAFATMGIACAQVPSWDDMVSTARTAWKKTVEAGKPLAERIAKEAPERFRQAKTHALQLVRRADRYVKSGDLEQKKALAAELWKVRGSLDLMAFLDPQTLKMFGITLPDLNRLRADVQRSLSALTKS